MKSLALFQTPSIRRRISISFLIVTFFVVAMVVVGYFQLRQIRPSSDIIVHDSADLVNIQQFSTAVSALDADLERYLTIRGVEYRDSVQNDLQEMTNALALLQADPAPGTQETLSELGNIVIDLQAKVDQVVNSLDKASSKEINRSVVSVYKDIDQVKQLQAQLSADTLTSLQSTALTQGEIAGNVLTQTVLIGLVVSIIAIITTLVTDRSLRTISSLTNTAVAISGGDFSRIAPVESKDEIGTLATAFNTMTSQLRDLIGSLEQRVAERTEALSSVAEVSTAASTILETDRLLQKVVDLAKERFGFYHAHIYLMDATGTSLVLSSGAGAIGQQMVADGRSIPLDREQSLVARAAREKKGVTVNDVTTAPDFLPNPLLPDTHSELAVPMMVGDKVIGVFDVQSEMIGRFTEADIAVQTTLASQVASAVQNARSYTEVQRSQAQLSEALEIAKLANWEYDVARDRFIFNDHFYTIFHTTVEQEGGYELSSAEYAERLVYPEDLPMVGGAIEKALSSTDKHYSTRLEHRILYRDGSGIGYMSVEVHIERDDQGNILRYYGANQDITERKRLEVLMTQRAKQQEAINTITQRIQSATTIEDALQVAARELGHALGQKPTLVALEPSALVGGHKDNIVS